mmetsp:Transcript_9358/g.18195  ORF Transcript_9358/g.18195 Transcript_9358/m.18195 type:complete len:459 (-) Transcript_9358:53-1429(-)|eukprot:CAMPEP_0170170952 /NCGR_PEP_ID=MMETSP0040_2-20121228/3998_1 /TAXON_ID=641309 /ORGANISM="Lotharella oceanica, Strain CCMP622" /LENGTH=458 /DNA_ID=CAMNT_0010410687 /DNA_START=32 /DNA_END=1408 /DNA_ORIENTATION=-
MSGMTAEAREIMAYLKKYNLADQLNVIVNKLCKKRSDDPFGFLASRLHQLAAPPVITKVEGREILSSDARPAVQVDVYCKVDDSVKFVSRGTTSAPKHLPDEKRSEVDGDAKWYRGLGVKRAVTTIKEVIHSNLGGLEPKDQDKCDEMLRKAGKGKLGVSAMSATSVAICKAAATLAKLEYYQHVARLIDSDSKSPRTLTVPRPLMELIVGGACGSSLAFPSVMVYPLTSDSFSNQLQLCCMLHHFLGETIAAKFGDQFRTTTASGSFAAPVAELGEALKLVRESATAAGITLGEDLAIAVQAGPWKDGYVVKAKDKVKSVDEMVDFYSSLVKDFKEVGMLIDPLSRDDMESWAKIQSSIDADEETKGKVIEIIGDRIETEAGATIRIERSQTVSDVIKAFKDGAKSKPTCLVANNGATDTFAADLAVGLGTTYARFGGPRGQNVALYNRLLQIADAL